ncbi:MAG: hypothetical protein Q4Q18_07270 [Methanobrevibacter sp.]|nr:hypothetical protein [Methanobrevibacter sp.]
MLKRVILLLIISMALIGAVSAADQTSFKVQSEFEDLGDGVYVIYDAFKNADEILSVVEFNEHDWKDYTTNDTENKYVVTGENNTYNFTDGSVNEVGSFELIEVDGDKFIVDYAKTGNEDGLNQTFTNLMEFNKLNNVTPIEE